MKLFEKGDIVYFKEEYLSNFSSGIHLHKPDVAYKVTDFFPILSRTNPIIQNQDTGENYFVDSKMRNYLITESEWKLINRQKNLNQLLK